MLPQHLVTNASEEPPNGAGGRSSPHLAQVVVRNISALLEVRRQDEQRKNLQDRIADAITRFTGSMSFVYLHLFWIGSWVVINLGWTPLKPFDPYPFGLLTMIGSLEAIFLSTFVLISQNRMGEAAASRADLDLHISLLAEHEITRILTIVDAMAHEMGLEVGEEPDMTELKKDVPPEIVLEEMEKHEQKQPA